MDQDQHGKTNPKFCAPDRPVKPDERHQAKEKFQLENLGHEYC